MQRRSVEWDGEVRPWTVKATWSELQTWDEATIDWLAIRAFNQAGEPVAHWEGEIHEDAGHLTE